MARKKHSAEQIVAILRHLQPRSLQPQRLSSHPPHPLPHQRRVSPRRRTVNPQPLSPPVQRARQSEPGDRQQKPLPLRPPMKL